MINIFIDLLKSIISLTNSYSKELSNGKIFLLIILTALYRQNIHEFNYDIYWDHQIFKLRIKKSSTTEVYSIVIIILQLVIIWGYNPNTDGEYVAIKSIIYVESVFLKHHFFYLLLSILLFSLIFNYDKEWYLKTV